MSKIYFALETMGALVLLMILYANQFEQKNRTVKSNTLSVLLLANLAIVVMDAISWLDLGWESREWLLRVLITSTYIFPTVIVAIFSKYLYLHISDRTQVKRTPFLVVDFMALAICLVSLGLCLSGRMFVVQSGKFYPGSGETFYYLIYVIIIVYLLCLILSQRKSLGIHDLIASLFFCVVPLISFFMVLAGISMNLTISSLAVEMLLIYIMLQSDKETLLMQSLKADKLTGLHNRRAYEDDILTCQNIPSQMNFVYASIDVNGLKVVNDTCGHAAGDELLAGVAFCLKRTFGNYGKVYRTGGDEFASIFFADQTELDFLLKDLKEMENEWHGSLVNSLSLAVGCASKREFPNSSIAELAGIADKRMYEEKAHYYENRGVDRKGQNEAHKVLCSLYTKILRINLTDDSYSIVDMRFDEQDPEFGFSAGISEWLTRFGKSGGVHPDDLENYLAKTNLDYMRNYFKRKKTPLYVLYRRRYGQEYRKVIMEIVPTKDYRDENQSLFLYVKDLGI